MTMNINLKELSFQKTYVTSSRVHWKIFFIEVPFTKDKVDQPTRIETLADGLAFEALPEETYK